MYILDLIYGLMNQKQELSFTYEIIILHLESLKAFKF